jgi:hypothetical protein
MTFGMRVMPPTRITSSISPAGHAGVLQRGLAGLDRASWIRSSTSASSLARVSFITRCFGPEASAVMNGRLISVSSRGQLDLGLFGGFLQPLQRQLVLAQVDALLLAELVGQVVDDAQVEILAAEEGVAVGRLHLEHAVADFQHGDVEGAAAEVVDRDQVPEDFLSMP